MPGLYIHIPFCRQACTYCDFHFSTSSHYRADVVKSIIREIEFRADQWQEEPMKTVYFGGGTPSQLLPNELDEIFNAVHRNFKINSGAEITFEANPEDLKVDYIKHLKSIGINRLSIGIQSFRDPDLIQMNRAHNAAQAISSVEQAANEGISSISVDLIYGIPGLSNEAWLEQLNIAAKLPINHLSCYALTVEQGTPLAKMINQGKRKNTDDEQAENHFQLLQNWAPSEGFSHYEVSNLAREGGRAKHNSAYWSGESYLGIGPSAHSFQNNVRRFNIPNNQKYIRSLSDGDAEHEIENLQTHERFNEIVLTGMRTSTGIDKNEILKTGKAFMDFFLDILENHPDRNQISQTNTHILLSPNAWFRADGIASDFFFLTDFSK
jgi:oxygen-independent coproporphyrinogen-3 oxidase